jgi:hypothetical protein
MNGLSREWTRPHIPQPGMAQFLLQPFFTNKTKRGKIGYKILMFSLYMNEGTGIVARQR